MGRRQGRLQKVARVRVLIYADSLFTVRYASLFFVMGMDNTDNELLGLEYIHHFVEILDRYFSSVRFALIYRQFFLPVVAGV